MPDSSANLALDLRSLPTRTMNLYLYPMAGWGLGLIALYVADRTAWALPLCFPLAIWNAGLSIVWGRDLIRRYDAQRLTQAEVLAGVRSVGSMLAAVAMIPGIVFLVIDPIAMSSWSTFFGIVIIAGLARLGVELTAKLAHRYASILALALACLALPLNTTGAVSVAAMVGFFDKALQDAGAPEDWKLSPHLPK
jgi:membrane protein DedA with SNARE-associated domain